MQVIVAPIQTYLGTIMHLLYINTGGVKRLTGRRNIDSICKLTVRFVSGLRQFIYNSNTEVFNPYWHGTCISICVINHNQRSIMKNKLIDTVIYVSGFISIVIVWLTA